jgi:hypothetical protein
VLTKKQVMMVFPTSLHGQSALAHILVHPKKKQILLRYRSKNIIASSRAGSALQKRLLLYTKQQKLRAKGKKTPIFFIIVGFR